MAAGAAVQTVGRATPTATASLALSRLLWSCVRLQRRQRGPCGALLRGIAALSVEQCGVHCAGSRQRDSLPANATGQLIESPLTRYEFDAMRA